ncbi:M23 family metallopeptidase, partial [Xanthovirga aplysinae]|uniref:M23 family metallopeptidase n=1 Tax=Xanthovirga aplysinae TaxID=2529853 RepID=UPI0012BC10C4
ELKANQQLYALSKSIDSLENQVEMQDQFILNLTNIMTGEGNDSSETNAINKNTITTQSKQIPLSPQEQAEIDDEFRKEFENFGEEGLKLARDEEGDLQELFLFKPVAGIVTDKYEVKNKHYGVDIVAKQDEPVKCVADGTVILSSWTQDSGYVIAVQHKGNMVSVYKHNAELLQGVGDFVKAGDVISIIGNTGELTTGPHLHFELWYNGNPVNPEEFITL